MENTMGDPPISAALVDHCAFSQVQFNSVEKFYVPGGDVMCYYVFTPQFIPHRKDWIGIFKVGWKTTREYYTFMWVVVPDDPSKESSKQQEVKFKAYYLPKDDEHYQFCYVDLNGVVRGASIPFQFRAETENDIVVVTTKERVEEIEQLNEELYQENQTLKNTCANLQEMLSEAQAELQKKQERVEETEQLNEELHQENQTLKDTCASLQDMLSEAQAELQKKQERVEETEQLNEELYQENQTLKGTCTSLQEMLSEAQAELQKKQERVEEMEQLNEELYQENQTLKPDTCANLQEMLSEAQAELQKKQEALQALEQDVEKQKVCWENEVLQLKEYNQEIVSEMETIKLQVEKLQTQLSSKDSELEKLAQHDKERTHLWLKQINWEHRVKITEQGKKLEWTEEIRREKETALRKKEERMQDEVSDLTRLHRCNMDNQVLQTEKDELQDKISNLQKENSKLSLLTQQPSDQGDARNNSGLCYGNPYLEDRLKESLCSTLGLERSNPVVTRL
ncbi:calcium-binding and coiled-coil domain-containing protein 2 isoform X3 [Meriones unguiculatus]|nr:calcium-binding and coiled-coil domain-containing protein 2 isoform X3 [Meriones unguiculatus]XP_060242863.1 calcium-binding and coiled-coil domain-containing protein 2 isoform X3 [Meriones unguiculatus]